MLFKYCRQKIRNMFRYALLTHFVGTTDNYIYYICLRNLSHVHELVFKYFLICFYQF